MSEPRGETLVVELLTEELPPKALRQLGEAFGEALAASLRGEGLVPLDAKPVCYASPRRLAVSIKAVLSRAPDQEVVEKLMPRAVAEDPDGKPSAALRGRLRKLGRPHLASGYPDVWDGSDHLYVESAAKAQYVWLRSLARGAALMPALQSALEHAVASLPIPKVMSYASAGYYNDVKFVRPAHRLLALHGGAVVPVSVLGLEAARTTSGHRFLARGDIEIAGAEAYAPTLEAEGKVVPAFATRRARIVEGLEIARAGARVIMPDDLLDEVTALVEWPKVYTGGFDSAFLEVPRECLILTMQRNQKYFALEAADGRLQNRFLLVANIDAHDPQPIIRGNERVLRARLADAKFFYDQDRKASLASRVPRLANVVYHSKLGSQLDRVQRLRSIARYIAGEVDGDEAWADRAAHLAKADLLTEMVGEFPELQGIMGRCYALQDGEPPAVAEAIGAQYLLRLNASDWAENPTGAILMAADRTETLVGIFGIGLVPSGDKDPYGLRRAALGLIDAFEAFGFVARSSGEPLRLRLRALLENAARTFASPVSSMVIDDLEAFVFERYRHQLAAAFPREVVDAVVDIRPPLDEVPSRVEAVRAFRSLPEAEALAAANKRIVNILRKSGGEAAAAVDRTLFGDGAEHDLFAAVQKLLPVVHDHVAHGQYSEALRSLASARATVDRFFDQVLVMAEDRAVRANRLALLRALAEAMNEVADISKLAA